jgi:hypothetical protein
MVDVQAIGSDLANPPFSGPDDGPDEVVLAPDLDQGGVNEHVHQLPVVGPG